ncbi:hypothetical protein PoB_007499100 [Plakobranchus ocellatus]|uniref:Uncharacterized protein n=1 Tax=Plakobranchus ocellatus TaxID=259542 RepID=A0AAV4DWJ9_9GAST|nr:hypothetical protein PoB_007499100 [Plakobranchus ocellatus]
MVAQWVEKALSCRYTLSLVQAQTLASWPYGRPKISSHSVLQGNKYDDDDDDDDDDNDEQHSQAIFPFILAVVINHMSNLNNQNPNCCVQMS